jgi:hypothetical protein
MKGVELIRDVNDPAQERLMVQKYWNMIQRGGAGDQNSERHDWVTKNN